MARSFDEFQTRQRMKGTSGRTEGKFQFEYSVEGSRNNGFIELKDRSLTVEEFRKLLEKVPGVRSLILHPKGPKAAQGNTGRHRQEHNFFVFSERGGRPMEFELTTHHHAEMLYRKLTQSVFFRTSETNLQEAWRIAMEVGLPTALYPIHVQEWANRAINAVLKPKTEKKATPSQDWEGSLDYWAQLATDHEACGQSCGNAPDELLAPGSGGQSCGKEMCEKAFDDWARRADEANKEL